MHETPHLRHRPVRAAVAGGAITLCRFCEQGWPCRFERNRRAGAVEVLACEQCAQRPARLWDRFRDQLLCPRCCCGSCSRSPGSTCSYCPEFVSTSLPAEHAVVHQFRPTVQIGLPVSQR